MTIDFTGVTEQRTGKSRRGFASLSAERRKEIASLGGKAAHRAGTAHEFTADEAKVAGQRGGRTVSRNRAHMQEIGRKGGAAKKHRRGGGRNTPPMQPVGEPLRNEWVRAGVDGPITGELRNA